MNSYKICLIGAPKSGKSSFIRKILMKEYIQEYIPTLGVEVYSLNLNTSFGSIILNLWDTAGSTELKGLGDMYYIQSDAAIIFYDATDKKSIDIGKAFKTEFSKICESPLIFEWVNKCESTKNLFQYKDFEKVSIMQGCYDEALLKVVRKLTRCENLVFV